MRRVGVGRLVVLLVWLLAGACSSSDERAEAHLEKAREYLEEDRPVEASLELKSALRFDDRNVEANNRLAELEIASGNLVVALEYLREAYRLDPTDADASLLLASLLRGDEPDRAEALVEGVIAREPENPRGYIGRSSVALARGNIRDAVQAARKAMELAPDDWVGDWQYGHVLQVMIREGQVRGEPVEENIYVEATNSFERYITKGGDAPWNAQVEQARIMAAWPTKAREAAAMFRIAVENAQKNAPREDRLAAAAHSALFARSVSDDKLLEWSLEQIVEMNPTSITTWRDLADLYRRRLKNPGTVWDRALAAAPEEPQVHIEYARFMISRWKLDEALAYLSEKAAEGIDPPRLLSAMASTQLAAGRLDDARATVRGLEKSHPDAPRTMLARAQFNMRRGQIPKAAEALRQLAEEHPDPDVYRLLGRAEKVLGQTDAAIAALDRARQLDPHFNAEDERMRARLLASTGDCEGAVENLVEIRDRMPLAESDEVLLARCRYATGKPVYGRKLLTDLLAKRNPPIEAIVLFAQKESDDPKSAGLVRRELEKLLRRNPHHWEGIQALTRIDASSGRGAAALERLDRAVATAQPPVPAPIRLLRAQLGFEEGREAGTLEDATAAFEAKPRLRGALELLVALQLKGGKLDAATAAAEKAQRVGAADDSRRLLLGRLYVMGGREQEALAIFEKIAASGTEDPALYYQMGLALRSLKRSDEAVQAFEKALSISTSFPEANDARKALEGTRSAGAS